MTLAIQPFDALDPSTLDALRASIKRFGIVVPIVVDARGRVIDGHHRAAIARELGITCPQIKRAVRNDDDAMALAFSLNSDRRHLTAEQRRAIVADLRGQGYSLRAIAGVTKTSRGTVANDVAASGVQVGHVTGEDGKTYSASQPKRPPVLVDADGVIQNATQQGAGDDGPASGGDAGSRSEPTPETGPLDAASSDGADSHDVGRAEPEPAPNLASLAEKVVESEVGYRATSSRYRAATRTGLMTLDPERVAQVTPNEDRAAVAAFAHDLIAWASDLLGALDDKTHLRSVK